MPPSQTPQNGSRQSTPPPLTPREQEILTMIWSGLTSRQIAQRLGISLKTVDSHRAMMMKKVRVSNAAQLLKAALEQGLLKIE
jgi:DNA-binding NarL/FixJ family response regulator